MRLVLEIVEIIKHVEEVLNIVHILAGHVVGAAHAVAIGTCCHGRRGT